MWKSYLISKLSPVNSSERILTRTAQEVQPLYYSDLFVELFECVNKLEM